MDLGVLKLGKQVNYCSKSVSFPLIITIFVFEYNYLALPLGPWIDLRYGWVPLIDQSACRAEYVYGQGKITDGMICAGYLEEDVDTCDGDSGGPLACYHNGRILFQNIIFLTCNFEHYIRTFLQVHLHCMESRVGEKIVEKPINRVFMFEWRIIEDGSIKKSWNLCQEYKHLQKLISSTNGASSRVYELVNFSRFFFFVLEERKEALQFNFFIDLQFIS